MSAGKLSVRGNITNLDRNKVVFENGDEETVDVIILAHGYKPTFPFLGEESNGNGNIHPGQLYLNMFHPRYAERLSFLGFSRPAIGSIPPVAELQARLITRLISGELQLSDEKTMRAFIKRDAKAKMKSFPGIEAPNVVVDWIPYMDRF